MEGFDVNSFFKSDEFIALDDSSKVLLKEFAEKVSGKSQMEAVAVFMEYKGKLNIDPEQQKALKDVLKAGLTPDNRKRFTLMETLLGK